MDSNRLYFAVREHLSRFGNTDLRRLLPILLLFEFFHLFSQFIHGFVRLALHRFAK